MPNKYHDDIYNIDQYRYPQDYRSISTYRKSTYNNKCKKSKLKPKQESKSLCRIL